jgi:hypothetical protein
MNFICNNNFNYFNKLFGKWKIFLNNIGGENLLINKINKPQDIKLHPIN